jgi:hypothetical protein
MSHMARKTPAPPDSVAPRGDEGSIVRERAGSESGTRTRPAVGSLDDRLEKKMRIAGELMKDLPSTDSRVRLLYAAIMRRDEALLDGVLAELNKLLAAR